MVLPAPGSSQVLEVVVPKRGSKNKKLIPPIRGQIKRHIFACFMKKMKLWTKNLSCNTNDPSQLPASLSCSVCVSLSSSILNHVRNIESAILLCLLVLRSRQLSFYPSYLLSPKLAAGIPLQLYDIFKSNNLFFMSLSEVFFSCPFEECREQPVHLHHGQPTLAYATAL